VHQRYREKQKQKGREGVRRGGRAVAVGHVTEDEGGGRELDPRESTFTNKT